MIQELTITSPPQSFSEPLTLDEVKKYLELPERVPADTQEDAMLEGFIIAAREVAEMYQHRDLVVKQYDLHMDYFPYCLELQKPLISVDLLRYRNSDGAYTDMVADSEYIVDRPRGCVMPAYGASWPSFTHWPSSAVMVRYSSGMPNNHPFWSDSGQRVLIGMKMLISGWFTDRLPFEPYSTPIDEYPFPVRAMLSMGCVPRVI